MAADRWFVAWRRIAWGNRPVNLELELTEEQRELAAVEGWEVLADFGPAHFRTGVRERWHKLSTLLTN